MAVAERDLTPALPTVTGGPRPVLWTKAHYYQMAEMGWFQGRRVELIEGEIILMPAMGTPHWTAMQVIGKPLQAAFGVGYFVSNQCPLDLGPLSDPEPDFAVIGGEPRDYQSLPRIAALVLEVSASSLAYDRTVKGSLYARDGLDDYWIVNLEDRQVEVHRRPVPDADLPYGFGYAEIVAYQPGEAVSPLAAPGASIAVADLLP